MSVSLPTDGLQLRSLVRDSGELELSLARVEVAAPGPDEVVVRIEAAPINPSDLALLVGAADMSSATMSGPADNPVTTAQIPAPGMRAMGGRLGESMSVGNEGAGTVVAAGSSATAQDLMGRTVALFGGAMFGQYRTVRADTCLPLPADTTAAEGASCFVNPLTSLCMVETMRLEGHTALVHTAAASNLGQMLNKVCQADNVALVNIVRSEAQAEILRGIGARYICNSTSPTFMADLIAALAETGATLAFDAIGGGRLAGQILTAMEAAANQTATTYSRYGSAVHKQVYIYGMLDSGPTELNRAFGMAWGIGGWLLPPCLARIGGERAQALRQRVAAELKTTFASHYVQEISLAQTLNPEIIARYNKRATGEKYLINPNLDAG
ncbi:zinc-binding dehydrogenase [uncultured Brevundimonas sp.]|uniref:zinc-binding dehydrogenase n=1 Tax=uncultured Brevundimonas sp. TaxID=213418 RepID=UPI0030EC71FA|tara:strand:- start:47641 stop:48789 length:1149 start_codon:yes stop_codon:yes gene_type:complete